MSSPSASPSETRRSCGDRRAQEGQRLPGGPRGAGVARRRRRARPRPGGRLCRGAGAEVPAGHGAADGAGRRDHRGRPGGACAPRRAACQRRGSHPRSRPGVGPAPARRRTVRQLAPPGRGAAHRMAAGRGRRRGRPGRRAGRSAAAATTPSTRLPARPAVPAGQRRAGGAAPGGDPGPGPAASRGRDRRRPQARAGGRLAGCSRPAVRGGGGGLPRAGGAAGHRERSSGRSRELLVRRPTCGCCRCGAIVAAVLAALSTVAQNLHLLRLEGTDRERHPARAVGSPDPAAGDVLPLDELRRAGQRRARNLVHQGGAERLCRSRWSARPSRRCSTSS